MPIHWTEFPNRVEKFGDLFDILDTFDHDLRVNLIHSGSREKETDESAYTVEFAGGGRFLPRPDRIPGWEQLATLTEREYGSEPSVYNLRAIRGRVSEVLDVPIGAVNDLSILQVVEALDEVNRTPAAGAGDFLLAEYRWLKVTQVAKLFALNAGQVSKLCDAGTLATNGKTGHDRRVDVLSAVRRELDRINAEDGAGGRPGA
jgi:hypothetical protein